MKREIQTQSLETTTDEITICDKCGLEADEPFELYSNPRMLVHYGWTEDGRAKGDTFTAPLMSCFDVPQDVHALLTLMRQSPGKLQRVDTQMIGWEDSVELCKECYDEVFSWGGDE